MAFLTTEYVDNNSVFLSAGMFSLQVELLSISAIGSGSWRFGLNYLSGLPSDSALGDGFQYAQNVSIGELPDGDITLYNGNHTTETFDYDAANNSYSSVNNNTAAILTTQGTGADQEFILSASNGSVSKFYGARMALPKSIVSGSLTWLW